MDRRIVFFLVFIITLVSTICVSGVCLIMRQPWVDTVLYSLAAMWIMGIVSQLLLQNLFYTIVKPLQESWQQKVQEEIVSEINLDDVEEIDQAQELLQHGDKKNTLSATSKELAPPTVGVHVEQKG